jgi:hypothetical protein
MQELLLGPIVGGLTSHSAYLWDERWTRHTECLAGQQAGLERCPPGCQIFTAGC